VETNYDGLSYAADASGLVDEENEELSNRVQEGASEEEIARLRAEVRRDDCLLRTTLV
jgi:hypothetical protein